MKPLRWVRIRSTSTSQFPAANGGPPRRDVNTLEDDVLGLVTALFAHEAGSPANTQGFDDHWASIRDQRRAVFGLTMLLGTMIDHEAVRRDQPFGRVVNQMRSDIAGDRFAHELGIEPRD